MSHEPLSERLGRILVPGADPEAITLNSLMQETEGRGLYLLIILFSLPFITPLPMPGLSNILGVVIFIMGLRLALELPPRLPKFIGERTIRPKQLKKIVGASVKFLRFLERWVRPRRTTWLTWRLARCGNALLLAFMAFLLALPLPPVVPLTNTLPSYAIILIAASMMEEDGVLIWVGYAVSIGTCVYLLSAAGVIIKFFLNHYDGINRFLRSWL